MRKPSSYTDEKELLRNMQKGDVFAFEIIYHRYKELLYVHACRHLYDQEEARDIIHDIFSNLWQNRQTLRIQETLTAYLYQSVRNRVINYRLKNKRADDYIESFQNFLDNNSQLGTDYLVREKMLIECVEREIAALPKKMRKVFELSRKNGLTHKEIAGQLNISEQSVRSHIKGALKILRPRLGMWILFVFIISI